MIDLSCNSTQSIDGVVYDNLIEYYFHDFFSKENIDINDKLPQSVYRAAFIYVYNNLFKPIDYRPYNNTTLNTDDIDSLEVIYNIYEYICVRYNIVPFIDFFVSLTGITKQTICNWYNKAVYKGELSNRYFTLAQKIKNIPKIQVQNKLADDRTGVVVLANNDIDIGLEYNGKRQLEEAAAKQLANIADLRNSLTNSAPVGLIQDIEN